MPFYDYMCPKCGHIFEEFLCITDDSIICCPECNTQSKRLISYTIAQVMKDAKELGEQIKEEAKKDIQDIKNGDMEKAADYFGEAGALELFQKK